MVTHVDQISTPPTPADPPTVFEERAAQVWSDLARAIPQLNQQADENNAAAIAADQARVRAIAEADAALGYRNEANAARAQALGHAGTAAQSSAAAEASASNAVQYAGRAEAAAEAAESVVANAVQQTSSTGAALLPEGGDAQRPGSGSIPAGKLVIRGSTQDAADYKPEFWSRVTGAWQALASRPWVAAITDALGLRTTALEARPRGLGDGQTWQTVSRSPGVTYTNATKRPIVLRANASGSSAAVGVYVSFNGGPNIQFVNASSATGPAGGSGGIVVPLDAEYVITLYQVTTVGFTELRT